MSKDQLNEEEKEILRSYNAGEFKPLEDSKKRMAEYKQVAKHTLQKTKNISIQ